jgi:hypothetical protein
VQHTLLALGIALILAIAAALAAPAFVTWDDWRATFESQAAAVTGAPVRIRGRIEATLLPTPSFIFRDVVVGSPDTGNGLRAGEVRGVLSLGPLMRGTVEAEEFVLVQPTMRIAAAEDGRLPLPLPGAVGGIALERVSIQRGSLTVERAGEAPLVFDEIFADGEMRAREGPVRIEAVFRESDRRWSARLNSGRFSPDGQGRVGLALERVGTGGSLDVDGMLALAGGTPRFEGKMTLARRGMPGANWQLVAAVKASEKLVSLSSLQLTLGASAAPNDFAGQIDIEPWRGGKIDGLLTTRRLDLDLSVEGDKRLVPAVAPLGEMLTALGELPLAGRIALAADLVAAGGGTVRDAKSEITIGDGQVRLERLEASLPGRGSIRAVSAGSGQSIFAGDLRVSSDDPRGLLRWLSGDATAPFPESGALRLEARAHWSSDTFALDKIEFSLGETRLGGSLRVAAGDATKRRRVDATLNANGADLDLLAPAARWASAGIGGSDLAIELRGSSLRLLGRSLGRIDAALERTSDGVVIERLVVDDFDGLSARAKGEIAAPIERPSGTIEFSLATTRPEGLATIAEQLIGADAARLLGRVASEARPLKLSGTATGAGSAAGVEIAAYGTLGEMNAVVAVNIDLLTQNLSEAQIALDARDMSRLVSLIGLPPGSPSGGGRLEIDLATPKQALMPVAFRLRAPGTLIAGEGSLRAASEGRIDASLSVTVDTSDVHPFAAGLGTGQAWARGGFAVTRKGETFSVDKMLMTIAGSKVTGALTFGGEKSAVGGKLAIERLRLAQLLGATLGSAPGADGFWPKAKLGAAPLDETEGAIELEIGALQIGEVHAVRNAKLRLELGRDEVAIENLSGELAGGKLAADARFVRGATFAFDGRGSLNGFDLARLTAPSEEKAAVRGRGTLTLSVAGNGATPSALVSSLAGQGTILLNDFGIERADPGAVGAVFVAENKDDPKDEIGLIAALAPAFEKAPLRIGKVDVPVIVAGGVARSGTARAEANGAQISAQASLDLARLALDASVEIQAAAPADATVRPGATLHWRGPLAAPERGIEAAALVTAITLRAMERETKRIEERDRALPRLPEHSDSRPQIEQGNPIAAVPPTPGQTGTIAPPAAPAEPAPTRPRVIDTPRTLPSLPPPVDIRPLPPIYRTD